MRSIDDFSLGKTHTIIICIEEIVDLVDIPQHIAHSRKLNRAQVGIDCANVRYQRLDRDLRIS